MASGGFFMVLYLVLLVMISVNGNWRTRTEAVKCVVMGTGFVRTSDKLDDSRLLENIEISVDGHGINESPQNQCHKNIVPFTHEEAYSYPSVVWAPSRNVTSDGHGQGKGGTTKQQKKSP